MCLNFSVTYVGVPYIAPAYGPRFAQVSLTPVPLRGHAATGHPWPDRSSPGIHAGRPTAQNFLSASREGRQIKKALRHEAADRPAFWRKCVLHNLCSRCRGTKAAFGDEVVAKSDKVLC